MAELKILIGFGESGKTAFAKQSKNIIINFDDYPVYGSKLSWEKSMEVIANRCNDSLEEDFVLDGYMSITKDGFREPDFKTLKENLKHHTIQPIIIFREAEKIVASIKNRSPPCDPDNVDRRFVVNTYKNIEYYFNTSKMKFYYATDNKFIEELDYKDVIVTISGIKKEDILKFFDSLKNIKEELKNETHYDSKYQDMEFLHGIKYTGYAGYATDTWRGIKDLIDWKDKIVADIGCLNGYYSFKIKDMRAKQVDGFDLFQQACDSCYKIKELNCYDNMGFFQFDANKDKLECNYDVILLLNMLHHLNNPGNILGEAFKNGENVIMETQFDNFNIQKGKERMRKNTTDWDKQAIEVFASTYGHKLIKEVKSGRPFRTILHFKK